MPVQKLNLSKYLNTSFNLVIEYCWEEYFLEFTRYSSRDGVRQSKAINYATGTVAIFVTSYTN